MPTAPPSFALSVCFFRNNEEERRGLFKEKPPRPKTFIKRKREPENRLLRFSYKKRFSTPLSGRHKATRNRAVCCASRRGSRREAYNNGASSCKKQGTTEKILFGFFLSLVCRKRQTERSVCKHIMMFAEGTTENRLLRFSYKKRFSTPLSGRHKATRKQTCRKNTDRVFSTGYSEGVGEEQRSIAPLLARRRKRKEYAYGRTHLHPRATCRH